ncbi:MAG TPA: hypothetical protein VE604_10035 [Candidatus Polarisedimenticolia bacterium]|nr:hypothetical protein [Candidatus Polarisedimenticolia bacterium]
MSLQTCIRWLSLGLLSVLLAPGISAQKADEREIKEFQDRVNHYLSAKKNQDIANKPTDSADKLAQQKQQTREKTQAARPGAQRGDIFTPAIAAYFKKQIASTLRGPDGDKVRASLRHAEPLPNVQLKVNAKYPRNLPLQSTPPTLLMHLPLLPKELQYRIVGSTLVLYDMSSDLIVDFMPNAVPAV